MENKNQEQINIDNNSTGNSIGNERKENDFQKIIDIFNNLGKKGVLNIVYILGIATAFLTWLEFDYSSSKTYVYSIFDESLKKRYGSVELLYGVPLSYVALIVNNMINEKTKEIVAFFLSSVSAGIVGIYFIDIYLSSKYFTVGIGAQLSFVISLLALIVSFIESNNSSNFRIGEDQGIKSWLEYYYKNAFNFSGVEKYQHYWRYEIFLSGLFFVVCTIISLLLVLVMELKAKDVPDVLAMIIEVFFLIIYLPSVALFMRYFKRNKEKTTQIMNYNTGQQDNNYQPQQVTFHVESNQVMQNNNVSQDRQTEIIQDMQLNTVHENNTEDIEKQNDYIKQVVSEEQVEEDFESNEVSSLTNEERNYSPFGDKVIKRM